MTKKTFTDIETIAGLRVSKSILKIIIMDFHARSKLTDNEVITLFEKYRLSGE